MEKETQESPSLNGKWKKFTINNKIHFSKCKCVQKEDITWLLLSSVRQHFAIPFTFVIRMQFNGQKCYAHKFGWHISINCPCIYDFANGKSQYKPGVCSVQVRAFDPPALKWQQEMSIQLNHTNTIIENAMHGKTLFCKFKTNPLNWIAAGKRQRHWMEKCMREYSIRIARHGVAWHDLAWNRLYQRTNAKVSGTKGTQYYYL